MYAGIVLSGSIVTGHTHERGNEHYIQHFLPGEMFCESFACNLSQLSTVEVMARKKSQVLFLKLSNLFQDYATRCPHASRMTANLLGFTTQSNLLWCKCWKV